VNREARKNCGPSITLGPVLDYRATRAAGSLEGWDLVGISPTDVVLVQVKTRDWPRTVELAGLAESCPWPYVTRLVHRWCDRQRRPDVRTI
jgi:hypothetical protein